MRMWMINPTLLCQQHLLGEHVEIHMLRGSLLKGHSLSGHLQMGQLEPQNMFARHDELVEEMVRRGMNHKSPLLPLPSSVIIPDGQVDITHNLEDLANRCVKCKHRQQELKGADDETTNLL